MFRIDVSSSYERFGLERNPFTDLSSEAIRDIEKIHVSQEIDSRIADILSDVIGENSGIALSLVGSLGSGKTQRLKGVHKLIQESGGMSIYQKIDSNDIIKTTLEIFSYFSEFEDEEDTGTSEESEPKGKHTHPLIKKRIYHFSKKLKDSFQGRGNLFLFQMNLMIRS